SRRRFRWIKFPQKRSPVRWADPTDRAWPAIVGGQQISLGIDCQGRVVQDSGGEKLHRGRSASGQGLLGRCLRDQQRKTERGSKQQSRKPGAGTCHRLFRKAVWSVSLPCTRWALGW